MTNTDITTPAWLLEGITGSTPGTLQLTNGRLRFAIDGQTVFDVPLEQISDINFPWYYFLGGVKFRISATPYRLSFSEAGENGNFIEARRAGKQWKAILKP